MHSGLLYKTLPPIPSKAYPQFQGFACRNFNLGSAVTFWHQAPVKRHGSLPTRRGVAHSAL